MTPFDKLFPTGISLFSNGWTSLLPIFHQDMRERSVGGRTVLDVVGADPNPIATGILGIECFGIVTLLPTCQTKNL